MGKNRRNRWKTTSLTCKTAQLYADSLRSCRRSWAPPQEKTVGDSWQSSARGFASAETAALFRGCLWENVLESWHERLYEENKQACAKHTFFQDLLYFPKTDCCQSSDTHIHTHYIYPKQSVSTFGMPWACQLRMKPVFLKPCTVAISTKEDVFSHSDCHYEIYWLQLKVNVTFCYEKTKKRI